MTEQLKHISDQALADLLENIEGNLERYRGDGFGDLADNPSWDIALQIEYDGQLLGTLNKTQQHNITEIDLENSKIVGEALVNLTPALANEELIWARLSHIEGFEYSQARWLGQSDNVDLISAVQTHMFAPTQTAVRDDHSLSRLWWNYHIAESCFPDDVEKALGLILNSADIRSNFVERVWMSSRRNIAAAILREMDRTPAATATEESFRKLMKAINRNGGGIVFEALNAAEADTFVSECQKYAETIQ